MVTIIVNENAYRLRNNGTVESSEVAYQDVKGVQEMTIQNDWDIRSAEANGMTGWEESIVRSHLKQLVADTRPMGDKLPKRSSIPKATTDANKARM